MVFPRIASLKSADAFRLRVAELGLELEVDESVQSAPESPLSRPIHVEERTIGNRFAILPMEGWDGTADGKPTELVYRRWQRFGESGAKLIWGGEAVAVRHDGRANPNQLLISKANLPELEALRKLLISTHGDHFGSTDDLLVGLQLTHSGRFARPNEKDRLEPLIAYHHPILDDRFKVSSSREPLSDQQIGELVEDFVKAAVRAQAAGFDFVDIKHCHGYFGHELLSAVDRPGRYGGSFENRARFLREIVEGIRREAPGLLLGVRLSLFDQLPFVPGADGVGEPVSWSGPYRYGFGTDPADPARISWDEPLQFLELLLSLGIRLVCLSAGSPYYNPHIQRPAATPPSDGYLPPEDPLAGVVRQIRAVAHAKSKFPDLILVGSAYSYLQEWAVPVAQAQVRSGKVDCIGLGRMVLSYPELPADALAGREIQRRKICRTFSDCTTGPRNGLVSGCYPLDEFYRKHPDAAKLRALAKAARGDSTGSQK